MVEDRNNSSEFSDDTIRRFLLGELSESEQPLFEQQLFTVAGLGARVRMAEIDLADDYAFERLSVADRALFEERFLVTSKRRRELNVSDALRDRFSRAKATAARSKKSTVGKRSRYLSVLERPAWKIAFGVLMLLILFGTVLLVVKEPRLTEQITNKIVPRRSAPRSSPQEMQHPADTSSPEHQTTPAPMPLHDSAKPSESVVLFPSSPDLGKIPTLTLPNGEKGVLRLRLAVTDQTVRYRAEVLTTDGRFVFSVDWLSGPPFDVDVPASLLKSGEYQIRLSDARDGSKKEVAGYYFRVR
jgi:hypothetical protein